MYAGTVTATTKENLNSGGTIFISGLKLPYIFKLWMCYSKNLLVGTYLHPNTTVIRGMTFYLVVEEVMKDLTLRRALGYMGDLVRVKERE